MVAQAMIMPKKYMWDRDGNPLAFGKVYTKETDDITDKVTYTTEDADVANTNPVILNGEGYASIYLKGSYSIVVDDADDNNIWTENPVSSSIAEEWVNCETPTYISTTSFSIVGDVTTTYDADRPVRIDNDVLPLVYSAIRSSSFGGGITTVVVNDAVVAAGIVGVCVSIVNPNTLIDSDILKNYSFDTIALMVASTALKLNDWITIEDYATGNGSETLFFKAVAAATGTADGGSYIDLPNTTPALQAQQNFSTEVSDKSFGCVCDGTADDTTKLQAANDFCEATFKTLTITGTPLITATINISLRVHWRFSGAFGVNGSGPTGPWSFLKKDDSMTTPAVIVDNAAKGVVIEGGGLEGDPLSNTGDGIVILGNSCILRDFSVVGMGNDGIRIGQDAAGTNSNNFFLDRVYSAANGRDGIHIRDQALGLGSNSNAGHGNSVSTSVNGRYGLYIQNVGANVFINYHAESNVSDGLYLDDNSEQMTFIGGDIEGNGGNNITIVSSRQVMTDAVDNGAGLIRITIPDTSFFSTGQSIKILDTVGTTEANGTWVVTVIDGTHLDLQGSTFANAYVRSGKVNNFAGNHFMKTTHNGMSNSDTLTSDLSSEGSGRNVRPVNAQGLFTPILVGTTTPGTPVYTAQAGEWQLVGDMCEVFFNVIISASTGMVGNLRIGGLPFLQADDRGTGFMEFCEFITFPAGTTAVGLTGLAANSDLFTPTFYGTGIAAALVDVSAIMAGGNTRVRGYFRYRAQVS